MVIKEPLSFLHSNPQQTLIKTQVQGDQQLNQFKHFIFHPWHENCEGASCRLSLPAVLGLGKFNFWEKFNLDERVCLQRSPNPFQLFVCQKKAWVGAHQVDSIFAMGLLLLCHRPFPAHQEAKRHTRTCLFWLCKRPDQRWKLQIFSPFASCVNFGLENSIGVHVAHLATSVRLC